MESLPKPDELLALDSVTEELFATLRRWFDVPRSVALDLAEIDSAVAELSDPVLIAAMAMRKLQALHLLATPGVPTTTDVIVTIVGDLDRALVQAPAMRLRLAAQTADWDAELIGLDEGADRLQPPAPDAVDAADEEAERFRALHGRLHQAVRAVLEASDGEIRVFS
jgi:hypothetical protein